ncbi:hypothetical protein [Williamsia serinedens]|uniref:hypothetical protein n=1 Tax=Williamsia serinedens TaxID=391736 RepID=UPI0020A237DE|nr:hypothetical protein [Williamsia serinedens]
MRDPGDFDAVAYVVGPFAELLDAIAAVSREITSTALAAADQGGGRLVAHSHSVVDVATTEGVQHLVSVVMCFDSDPTDAGGELVGTVLSLGPFASVNAASDAVAGEASIGCHLMYEREGLAFAGMSHDVTQTAVRGSDQFFANAAVTYRRIDSSLEVPIEPAAQQIAHRWPPPRRGLRFRLGGNKNQRIAHYRRNGG